MEWWLQSILDEVNGQPAWLPGVAMLAAYFVLTWVCRGLLALLGSGRGVPDPEKGEGVLSVLALSPEVTAILKRLAAGVDVARVDSEGCVVVEAGPLALYSNVYADTRGVLRSYCRFAVRGAAGGEQFKTYPFSAGEHAAIQKAVCAAYDRKVRDDLLDIVGRPEPESMTDSVDPQQREFIREIRMVGPGELQIIRESLDGKSYSSAVLYTGLSVAYESPFGSSCSSSCSSSGSQSESGSLSSTRATAGQKDEDGPADSCQPPWPLAPGSWIEEINAGDTKVESHPGGFTLGLRHGWGVRVWFGPANRLEFLKDRRVVSLSYGRATVDAIRDEAVAAYTKRRNEAISSAKASIQS